MIRDSIGDIEYWDRWVDFGSRRIKKMLFALSEPSKNPQYDPQYSFDASIEGGRLIFERYSRGDQISILCKEFPCTLDAWELSNRLATQVCMENNLRSCRDWDFDLSNLNHYNWCFWLVGLALALEIPDDQWKRLLFLVEGEGEDILLDRIIATREPERKIGTTLLHPKPYARLLKAINAPAEQQARLLLEFVENWYPELARKGKDALWWYDYGDPEKHPLEKGSYFGRWCVEAVAAVKAFSLDDFLCLGHENYPGDLLRPNGPTTHKPRPEAKKGWLSRLLNR